MSHEANQPQMIRKKARELLPGDYAITSGQIDKILSVERQFSSDSDHSDLAGRARLITSWYRVNRLVS